ncbi:MAG: 50S ribosomal protein L24 [Clostridia bacterium]|nr:50S ribosomal protein L24 [Clostridia bacterium]
MKTVHIKKDDTVIVISGDDKGTKGKVIAVSPEEGKAIVEGVNVQKKHVKPRKQGEEGGILDVEGAVYTSKLQLFCSNCDKGVRVGYKTENNKKIRVCTKCGKEI